MYLPASSGVRICIFRVAMSDSDLVRAEESAFPKRNDMMCSLYPLLHINQKVDYARNLFFPFPGIGIGKWERSTDGDSPD